MKTMMMNGRRNYFMINLHESMGTGWDQTPNPWICSHTRFRLGYMVRGYPPNENFEYTCSYPLIVLAGDRGGSTFCNKESNNGLCST